MLVIFDQLRDILFVSSGAILGANSRFIIYKKLEKYKLIRSYNILLINTFASFFLGLFLSFTQQISSLNFSYQLVLFLSIGFLGSLSTFSTFMYEMFEMFQQLNFSKALKLLFLSLASGIAAFAFGFTITN